MIEIPADVPADLVPLSWLIGVWEGTGVIDYRAGDSHYTGEFAHRVSFSHDGGPFLNYSATAQLAATDAEPGYPLVSESGFWRLAVPAEDDVPGPGLLPALRRSAERTVSDAERLRRGDGFPIEAAISHSDGVQELYVGDVTGPRITLETDAVVRSATAKRYDRASRMYGLVDSHLLWAWDIEAVGGGFASHASARLRKVS